MSNLESPVIKRTRKLTQLLMISVGLNAIFFSSFIYSILKEREFSIPIDLKPAQKKNLQVLNNEELLRAYSTLSFSELLQRLENKELVEDGFLKRDLALACLVAFHHFNLERALGGLSLQKRYIPFSNQQNQEHIPLAVFPGLADFQYQAIVHYAKTEKWPLTSQGIFFEIQRTSYPRDPTLLEAFYLTPHFHTAFLLFTRTGLKAEKELLVELLAQGDWNLLQTFTEEQRRAQDLTIEKRRQLLLEYLSRRSSIAARVFLEADFEFTSKRMSDAHILALFDLTPPTSPFLIAFAKELIVSPRCDAIWKRAANLLYTCAGEPAPEPYNHLVTIQRFAPHFLPEQAPAPVPKTDIEPIAIAKTASKRRVHVVSQGESLWKIARKYQVSVESIKKLNKLETDRVRTGKRLEIPEK
jgi:hypothetical protein